MIAIITRAKHKNYAWRAIYMLKYDMPHRLSGYWFSNDQKHIGRFHGGWIEFSEVPESVPNVADGRDSS
jgi:hypothetical protein